MRTNGRARARGLISLMLRIVCTRAEENSKPGRRRRSVRVREKTRWALSVYLSVCARVYVCACVRNIESE